MSFKPLIVEPKDYARALNVVGEHITVLASHADAGSYEIFLQQGDEGTGPPPHSHEWDEAFFVTGGIVQFGIGDETRDAHAGTLVHLPAGTMHWFRFGKGGGAMLSLTSRGQASKLFTDIDAEIPPGPPNLEKVVEVATRNGLKIGL